MGGSSNTSQHSVYLSPEIWAKLEAVAEEDVTSVSAIIRRVVVQWLREQERKDQ